MPRSGLATAGEHVHVSGSYHTARQRIGAAGVDENGAPSEPAS